MLFYCPKAGSSDDLRHVVLWISTTFPGCRMYGLGEPKCNAYFYRWFP